MPGAELPPVFVLAAGRGTRLGSGSAKTLFPIAGRPILEWILRECARQGISRVIVSVLSRHEQDLRNFCAQRIPPEIRLSIVVDETPQGTLGTLRNAWFTFPCDRFFVWLGDIVGRPPLTRMAEFDRTAPAVLLAHRRRDYQDSGVLTVAGADRLRAFREKPGRLAMPSARVWAGIARLDATELRDRGGADLGRDLWPALAARGGCRVADCGAGELVAAVDRPGDVPGVTEKLRLAGLR